MEWCPVSNYSISIWIMHPKIRKVSLKKKNINPSKDHQKTYMSVSCTCTVSIMYMYMPVYKVGGKNPPKQNKTQKYTCTHSCHKIKKY